MDKFAHVTVDLETMGNTTTAAIVAIGAVAFRLEDEEVETFYTNVSLESCLDVGLTVDASTIYWWLDQSDKARQSILTPGNRVPLHLALTELHMFCKVHLTKKAECWTHATFDAPILGHACRQTKIAMPIHFRNQRDIRTLESLTPWKEEDNAILWEGIPHNALDDALYQAKYIRTLLNRS